MFKVTRVHVIVAFIVFLLFSVLVRLSAGSAESTGAVVLKPISSAKLLPETSQTAEKVGRQLSTAGQLSKLQLKETLQAAGFSGDSLSTAFGVVWRESRGFSAIVSKPNKDGTRDYGLFQLNDVHRTYLNFSNILDPQVNASYAFKLSNHGTNWSHWGLGDKGWAGSLKKNHYATWLQLQNEAAKYSNLMP